MADESSDRIAEGFDEQVEDDEMSPEEAGFSKGEEDAQTRRNQDEDEVL